MLDTDEESEGTKEKERGNEKIEGRRKKKRMSLRIEKLCNHCNLSTDRVRKQN